MDFIIKRNNVNYLNKLTMNNKIRKLLWLVASLGVMSMVGCSDSDEGGAVDPNAPLALSSFTPNYGKYLEKVILRGEGLSKEAGLKVYFNQREAAVIGTKTDGTECYILAPRLPGEDCVISVVKGQDSLVYDEHFDYTVSTTVETICGNGTKVYKAGALTEAQVSPYYLCVDDTDNIFVISRNGDTGAGDVYTIGRIDLENNELISILAATGNVPCVAPDTQIVTCPTETAVGSFVEMNPLEMWAPRMRNFKWYDDAPPAAGWKHCMVVNPSDGMIYCRFYYGQLIKIDPVTYETELVCKTEQFDTYGMAFRPQEPDVLYFTGWQNHGLFRVDLRAETIEAQRLNSTSSGFRDGDLRDVRFNGPSQIFCDADGNMYIADCNNHCIRRMTPENQIETVIGVPTEAGWVDGTSDVAKFKEPRGIGVSKDGSVYVADFGNARIRKLSIN